MIIPYPVHTLRGRTLSFQTIISPSWAQRGRFGVPCTFKNRLKLFFSIISLLDQEKKIFLLLNEKNSNKVICWKKRFSFVDFTPIRFVGHVFYLGAFVSHIKKKIEGSITTCWKNGFEKHKTFRWLPCDSAHTG